MRLQDKVAIVTGGTRGIGLAVTEAFVKEGAKVIACATNPDKGTCPDGVDCQKLNVTDVEAVKALVAYVQEKYGKVDILVNNAGITKDGLTNKMTDEMWNQVIEVNLKGVFNITREVAPLMMAAGKGSIINVSSVVGEFGNIGQANYAATKAGVLGLTMSWAKEFARKGAQVRVNSVAPGYTMTEMLETVPQDLLDKFAAQTMLGRLGQPEEIAQPIVFLASDDSSYITGHNLSINGGMRL